MPLSHIYLVAVFFRLHNEGSNSFSAISIYLQCLQSNVYLICLDGQVGFSGHYKRRTKHV